MARHIDMVGQKHGMLTVIERAWTNKVGIVHWKCRCDCGKECTAMGSRLRKGHKASCGCQWRKRHHWRGYEEITGCYFNTIRDNAEKRGICFELSIEYAWSLFLRQERKCALSGCELKFASNYRHAKTTQTASLDRIDSKVGYIEGNVQWVHKDVNRMKQAFEQDEFVDWCRKISNHIPKSGGDSHV